MTIVAVCVVSAGNAPLFVRVYADEDEALRFHTLLHCALDVTDERLAAPPRKARAGAAVAGALCATLALTHCLHAGGWLRRRLPGLPGPRG